MYKRQVLFKPFLFILFLIPVFSFFLGAAEGGPCKDYGECDEEQHDFCEVPYEESEFLNGYDNIGDL